MNKKTLILSAYLFLASMCPNVFEKSSASGLQNKTPLVESNKSIDSSFVENVQSESLDCKKLNEVNFKIAARDDLENKEENAQTNSRKALEVYVRDIFFARINLPMPDEEVKNFSLENFAETRKGFDVKVSWGGGNHLYQTSFKFKCRQGNFYFYEQENLTFASSPVAEKNNSLPKKKTLKIKPNISLERFDMLEYLQ